MDIEIRPEPDGEALLRMLSVAFGSHPDQKEIEKELLVHEPGRALGAFDGAELVGAAAARTLTLTIPGGELTCAGISNVGVLPTHRRRGVMSALMPRQLEDIRDRGEPVAALFATESAIYGRYGYGPATLAAKLSIERPHSAFAMPVAARGFRLLSRGDALTAIPPIYERVRRTRPGLLARTGASWEYRLRDIEEIRQAIAGYGEAFFVLCEGAEGAEGYAIYLIKEDWTTPSPNATLFVGELMAASPDANAALWRYCLDVDLVARTEAWDRPADDPLQYLLADPRRLEISLSDGMWIRLVDVAPALAARRYPVEGRVVLAVRDALCEWNEDRFLLEAGADGAECAPTERTPDLTLSAADLGAAYLGGTSLWSLHQAGRVAGDLEAVRRADRMFSWRPVPWCAEYF